MSGQQARNSELKLCALSSDRPGVESRLLLGRVERVAP